MSDIKLGPGRGAKGRDDRKCDRKCDPKCPDCPVSSLVGPIEGAGALLAGEDIPIGSVIALGGSAVLAIGTDEDALQACLTTPVVCCPTCIQCPPGTKCGMIYGAGACVSCLQNLNPVIGVASAAANVGEVVQYVSSGPIELDTAVWDSVTGGTGGLIPNAAYYLSQTTPGHLSAPPNGGVLQKVGIAISPTVLHVQIGETLPAELSSVLPTNERVTATQNLAGVPVSPTIGTSFVVSDGNAETQFVTLADGASDGFQKTIVYYGIPGAPLIITPANFAFGTQVELPDTGGTATFAWDSEEETWSLVSTFGGTVS